jgi:saccharopine dehydrogenase (NAD+, L-lysine forming)
MKIGILREEKMPPDKRVPFTPEQCSYIRENFSGTEVIVQPSPIRCFTDADYIAIGIEVKEDLSDCDVLMGVKEVPAEKLVPGKTYFFFSHTIKKQPYNRQLLQQVVVKGIQLIDYETLTDRNGMRILGFGRFAGLVGAYNGLRGYGLRTRLFEVRPAYLCRNLDEIQHELKSVKLPGIKIVVTGGGRVAGGVLELLKMAGVRQVDADEYLSISTADKPVFVRLDPGDYNRHRNGHRFELLHFYNHPEEYEGTFGPYLNSTDMLIGAAYWDPKAPVLFNRSDTGKPGFRIKMIADITCDIDGSIPTTLRASTIDEPFYDFDPVTEELRQPFSSPDHISVMAVDNLPCEIPADASLDFGQNLIEKILPCITGPDHEGIIDRAAITRNGALTERYKYLQDYLDGNDKDISEK